MFLVKVKVMSSVGAGHVEVEVIILNVSAMSNTLCANINNNYLLVAMESQLMVYLSSLL